MSSDPEDLDREEPRRSGPFGLVPTRAALDPKLTKGALRLLVLLCSYAGKLRFTWVGQRTLAERLMPGHPMGRRNIRRQLAELETRGYIRISRKRGKTNGYHILHDPGVDAYVAPTPDADTAPTNTTEVGAKVSFDWAPKSTEVGAPVAAETEVKQKVEQIAPRAAENGGPRVSQTPSPTEDHWTSAPKEERVPMSSVFPPGVTNAKEMVEHIRNQKAAAKEKQATEGLVEEMFDAEVLEEEEVV